MSFDSEFFHKLKTKRSIYQIAHANSNDDPFFKVFYPELFDSLNLEEMIITTACGDIISSIKITSNAPNDKAPMLSLAKRISSLSHFTNGSYISMSISDSMILAFKNELVFFLVISNASQCKMAKLFLQFISIAFFNFIGNKSDLLSKSSLQGNQNAFSQNFQVKVFELYFAFPLVLKFESIIKCLFSTFMQYETIKGDNSEGRGKLKNIYILDGISKDVLFQYSLELDNLKDIRIDKSKELWREILFQCDKIPQPSFQSSLNENFNLIKKISKAYTQVEFTSTYPRYYAIIKFISVNNGYYLIQVYAINRLSRDNNKHKEITVITSDKAHLTYNELISPHLNQHNQYLQLEKWFIEYFACFNRVTSAFYFIPTHLFYFDQQILYLIDRLLDSKVSFDNLLGNITQCLQEFFMNQSAEPPPYANFEAFLQFDKYAYSEVFRDNDYREEAISIKDNEGRKISNINRNDIDNTISLIEFNTLMNNRRKSTYVKPMNSLDVVHISQSRSYKNTISLLLSIQDKLIHFEDNGNSFNQSKVKLKRYSVNFYNVSHFKKKENNLLFNYFNQNHSINELLPDSIERPPLNYIPK